MRARLNPFGCGDGQSVIGPEHFWVWAPVGIVNDNKKNKQRHRETSATCGIMSEISIRQNGEALD